MPYDSTSELPEQAKHLTSKEKRAFKHAFNSAVNDGKSEKSAFKIAWHAAKGAGERSPDETVDKHLQGQHDQDDHDPTVGDRIRSAGESASNQIRDLRRGGIEQAASRAERGARSFTQEASGKELLTTGAYATGAAAGALITRSYIPRSPTTAAAYGAYSLAMLALAGGTANDVLNRQGQGVNLNKKEPTEQEVASDAEDLIEEIADRIDVTPAEFIEDLGDWMISNEHVPGDLDGEMLQEFIADQYDVEKRVGDTSGGDPYDPGMDDLTPGGSDELTIDGEIAKVDADLGQVFGWASITKINGEPVVDLQNDYLETHELEKAAYDYVLKSRIGGEMHERMKKSAPKQVGTLIESMMLTPEKIEKMGLPEDTPHGWWVGFQVSKDDIGSEAWENVKKGKYTGFSIHGMGKRMEKRLDEVGKKLFDRTPQEYEGWLKRMSRQAGVPAEKIDRDLKSFLSEEGIGNPDDDDVHEFLMSAYNSSDDAEETTKAIAKHLIGRHEQSDHDPTKGKSDRSHARGDHSKEVTAAGAAGGTAAGLALGGPIGAAVLGLAGAQAGSQKGAKGRAARRRGSASESDELARLTESGRPTRTSSKRSSSTPPPSTKGIPAILCVLVMSSR
jgi:cation transport regulator ChaB